MYIVDGETRDLWVLDTARATLERLKALTDSNPDALKAKEHYRTETKHYASMVLKALRSLQEEY